MESANEQKRVRTFAIYQHRTRESGMCTTKTFIFIGDINASPALALKDVVEKKRHKNELHTDRVRFNECCQQLRKDCLDVDRSICLECLLEKV